MRKLLALFVILLSVGIACADADVTIVDTDAESYTVVERALDVLRVDKPLVKANSALYLDLGDDPAAIILGTLNDPVCSDGVYTTSCSFGTPCAATVPCATRRHTRHTTWTATGVVDLCSDPDIILDELITFCRFLVDNVNGEAQGQCSDDETQACDENGDCVAGTCEKGFLRFVEETSKLPMHIVCADRTTIYVDCL